LFENVATSRSESTTFGNAGTGSGSVYTVLNTDRSAIRFGYSEFKPPPNTFHASTPWILYYNKKNM
jgi:hypothetical protein